MSKKVSHITTLTEKFRMVLAWNPPGSGMACMALAWISLFVGLCLFLFAWHSPGMHGVRKDTLVILGLRKFLAHGPRMVRMGLAWIFI